MEFSTLLPVVGLAALGFGVSSAITRLMCRRAAAYGFVDVPNDRSSHVVPTPRGGGVAIVVTTTLAALLLWWMKILPSEMFIALLGGGLAVAAVGLLDDRRPVPARMRLVVHFGAALWAMLWLGGLPQFRIGAALLDLGWTGTVCGALTIVWTLNLFNFMDGIDGLAASETLTILVGAIVLFCVDGSFGPMFAFCLAFAAAVFGFLVWNWPPARIFMGDVGSGYVGYVVGVSMVDAARGDSPMFWSWLILGGLFFTDATVTVIGRAFRGKRLFEAHRSHAYQVLASRLRSHKSVTVAAIAINSVWLFPCAFFAYRHPLISHWVAIGALAPLVILVFAVRSTSIAFVKSAG